jgi:hypothetical protein
MDTDKHRCAVRSSLSVFIRVHLWQLICLRDAILFSLVATARLLAAEPAVDEPAIRVITDDAKRPVAFEAVGLPAAELTKLAGRADADEAFGPVFSLHVVNDSRPADLPAMAGSYAVKDSVLRFTPRYSLRPGTAYRAVLHPDGIFNQQETQNRAAKAIFREVSIPGEAAGDATEVTRVYPTAAVLPENQLRFYIHFSAAMGRGDAYRHLRLLDRQGEPVDLAFLEIGEELWDARNRRLTLLIDPGRIKRGLRPREELGPVLETGREYTLAIDGNWRDAKGHPLKADFTKRFRAGPPVETAIDTASWKITPPAAGSSEPLVVRFPRPLDQALVERTITVATSDGAPVAGRGIAADEERRWEFGAEKPWKAGKYTIVVDKTLEDISGNRIGRPFDVDLENEIDRPVEAALVKIAFEVK